MAKTDTRLRMIHSALELFHQNGVNATSLDQVLAHSQTGKSQFTHYFKNKEGLIHAVLRYLHESIEGGHTPTGYTLNSWSDLDRWFQSYIDFQKSVDCEKSCPVGTIAADITNDQPLLREDVQIFLDWARGQLAHFFTKKKAAKQIKPGANPEALADFCISIMQGGMLLSKMRRDTRMFKNAAKEALTYIHSLRVLKN
jgi:TetR/AcrR family transcriptional repressor of nem operon